MELYGREEHEAYHYATDAELDQEEARAIGEARPDTAWVCTGRDVWHVNPFYEGPEVAHPEDIDYYAEEDILAIDLDYDNNKG